MAKNIVLLSDGTGNGAAKQHKTNVWRLYQALDLRHDDQIAFYDDGVGSQQFLPLKLLGGAFGWGLKRNVIRLYKALCRTYRDGDRIYLFGFSRGAFTVRMLAGLVASRGLYTQFRDERDLEAGARNQFAAYRLCYGGGLLTSWIRRRLVGGTSPYPSPPEIEFIGVWDTVEAYGFPVDELAILWDRFVLPLRFENQELPENVRRACQALSIDEERQTFRPVLWDEKKKTRRQQAIEQVWFAGVHSDVGGGYPRNNLALVSLDWMISKVVPPPGRISGLRFITEMRKRYERRKDWHGVQHDSRSGLGAFYRYRPRDVSELCEGANIGTAKVHRSVLERIQRNVLPYAPTGLPADYEVVPAGRHGSHGPVTKSSYEPGVEAEARKESMEAALDVIFWRTGLYFAFLATTVFALATLVTQPDRWMDVSWQNPWWQWAAAIAVSVVAPLAWLKRRAYVATQARAAAAWSRLKGRGRPPLPKSTSWLRGTLDERPKLRALLNWLPPLALFGAVLVVTLSGVSRAAFSVRAHNTQLCTPTEPADLLVSRTVSFGIKKPCFATRIRLAEGTLYRFDVGEAAWNDGYRKGGPDGYPSRLFLPFVPRRRHATERWLKLMGRVGPTGRETFAIGSGPTFYRARSDGELSLYVNDAVLGVPWPGDAWSWPYRWRLGGNVGLATVTVSAGEQGI
ncbi:MAG: DUF2235 domain-containing protein [Acidimicrobiia bacterium]|nr:DUF2235 domain-containing protein [Acidimicrobiia bacterium]